MMGKYVAPRKGKMNKKWIIYILCSIMVFICVVITSKLVKKPGFNSKENSLTQVFPEYRDIVNTVEGSGVLEVVSKFSIVSETNGFISDAVGQDMQIESGEPLFVIASVNESRKYQSIRSSVSGIITDTFVSVGDYVTTNQNIVKIRDSDRLLVHSYFEPDFAQGLSIGEPASVLINWGSARVEGIVTSIANSNSVVEDKIVREVVVTINNTGKITDRSAASVTIGQTKQTGSATVSYITETVLKAQSEGVVVSILKKGDVIEPDVIVATITNNEKFSSYQDPQNNVFFESNDKDAIQDGFVLEAPFTGQLAECFVRKGDYVSKGTVLGTFANLDYLRLSIKVDEYQISRIQAGQSVHLTVYAFPGQNYEGYVTNISKIGAVTGGIASYSVIITVPRADGLIPGMRVDAKIETANKMKVLSIPSEAITRDLTVLITRNSPNAVNATTHAAPSGYVYVPVTIGVSDDSFTEITDGLSDQDVVAFVNYSRDSLGDTHE